MSLLSQVEIGILTIVSTPREGNGRGCYVLFREFRMIRLVAVEEFKTAWGSRDLSQWTEIASRIETTDPFLFAYIADIVELFRDKREDMQSNPGKFGLSYLFQVLLGRFRKLDKAQTALEERFRHLENWDVEGNKTIQALRDGTIPAGTIVPHIRHPAEAYADFYADQNEGISQIKKTAANAARPYGMAGTINHAFRHLLAIGHVELLFGLTNKLYERKKIRWIDIACGSGNFTNSVNAQRYASTKFEIVGADLQPAKIEIATARAAEGRTFFSEDAFELLRKNAEKGRSFDIVSMFEFLEHLEDPLALLSEVAKFKPKFIIAASPLEQRFDVPLSADLDRVHLWSFSRAGWEAMFEAAGFTPVYANEAHVGRYIGGLNWLTLIAGPREEMISRRTSYLTADKIKAER